MNSPLVTFGLAVLCLILGAVAFLQYQRNRTLADQLLTAQFDNEIRRIQVALTCPPDEIDGDYRAWDALDEVRLRFSYPATESYHNLVRFALGQDALYNAPLVPTTQPAPLAALRSNSLDLVWINRSQNAAEDVTFAFEHSTALGLYLGAHPAVFQTRLRPLLFRLARAKTTGAASAGARALYVAGDRSPELRDRLQHILSNSDASDRTQVISLLRECFPATTLPSSTPAPER